MEQVEAKTPAEQAARFITTTFASSDTPRMTAVLEVQRVTSKGCCWVPQTVTLTFEGLQMDDVEPKLTSVTKWIQMSDVDVVHACAQPQNEDMNINETLSETGTLFPTTKSVMSGAGNGVCHAK